MARPLKEIDPKQFVSLCGLQCTREEICTWFDVTEKTLEGFCKRTYGQGFSLVYAQKRSAGKISLRRHQWRLAEKNTAMAIFLGKNYLGQSDVSRIHLTESKDDVADELERYFSEGQADRDSDILPEQPD